MKYKIIITCLFFVILNAQCKKDSNNATDVLGLPTATQIGANTFGCLVNGEPWQNSKRDDLSLDLDLGFNNGGFGIVAYRNEISTRSQMIIGVGDSLRTYPPPRIYNIGFKKLGAIIFTNKNRCELFSKDSSTFSIGYVNVKLLDLNKRIIAGEFEGMIFNKRCTDTLKITKGRFDIGF